MTDPFDVPALAAWLADAGVGAELVSLAPIGDGLSNLTYAATTDRTTVVVRRGPPPPLPRGANDMLREARILRALAGSGVPVPRVHAVAGAGEVAEVPCYAMERLTGFVPGTTWPAALDTPDGRRAGAEAFVDVLAALHAVDPAALGLDDLGRSDGYLQRRLERLPRLVEETDGALPAAFAELRDELAGRLPRSGPPALVHGDYRLGNVVLADDPPARVAGVLDWELATLGDPLADLGYTLATWAAPGEPLHALTELSAVTLVDGFPTRAGLAERYLATSGRPRTDLDRLAWYEAFALFGVAVLFEYNRRKADGPDGRAHYADPALVAGLLHATRAALGRAGAGVGQVPGAVTSRGRGRPARR